MSPCWQLLHCLSVLLSLASRATQLKPSTKRKLGSPFTQQLAAEYRDLANHEQNIGFDYPDALHFARKGLTGAGWRSHTAGTSIGLEPAP